jgi:hypothetical protein
LEYVKLGTRLARVGDWKVEADRGGHRVRRIGRVMAEYRKLRVRPRSLMVTGDESLSDEELVVVFFVLNEAQVALKAQ